MYVVWAFFSKSPIWGSDPPISMSLFFNTLSVTATLCAIIWCRYPNSSFSQLSRFNYLINLLQWVFISAVSSNFISMNQVKSCSMEVIDVPCYINEENLTIYEFCHKYLVERKRRSIVVPDELQYPAVRIRNWWPFSLYVKHLCGWANLTASCRSNVTSH